MIERLALSAVLAAANMRYRAPMLTASLDPVAAQWRALRKILQANRGTEFGIAHHFGEIVSRDDYRAAVDVQTFETLANAISRQAQHGAKALTEQPPLYYARTSGTTAAARDFPVTAAGQATQRAAQRVLAATLAHDTGFFDGRIAGLSGARIEGALPSGQPYGSASGQTYASAPWILRRRFAVPEAVFAMSDADEKYRAYAAAMMAAPDLSGIITANPSTLVCALAHIDGEPAKIWPHLSTLVTWTGGNCQVALERLRPMLPSHLRVVEIGYRASEFVGTINVDAARNLCLPDLTHSVFEFVEEERWEAGDREFLWLDQVEQGRRYYIFATTPSGLYRYHINDVVEVTGRIGNSPTLGFVRKGQGMTSITGEKLHEDQVIAALRSGHEMLGLDPDFYLLVADAAIARYRLYHEGDAPDGLAEAVDRELAAANIEYAQKRASGRLGKIEPARLRPGAGEAFRASMIAAGQREAQIKVPVLIDAGRLTFDFSDWVHR